MIPKQVYQEQDKVLDFVKGLWIDTKNIKDLDLLLVSMIHKSFAKDFTQNIQFNERLEFVGDAILGGVIAKMLYINFPDYDEAKLTLYKIALVREETLAQVAKDIWLNKVIFIGHWEEKTWWREKNTILADAFEAFIGYLYIDMWEETVYRFVENVLFKPYIEKINIEELKSYKSKLQEYVQKLYKIVPEYKDFEFEKDKKGNVIVFKAEVYINWEKWWEGFGPNKKRAQEEAARNAYKEYVEKQS